MTCTFEGVRDGTPVDLGKNATVYNESVDGISADSQRDMLQFLEENFKKHVDLAIKRLQNQLGFQGKFTYPGAGDLIFGNPFFTHSGHILADITLKP